LESLQRLGEGVGWEMNPNFKKELLREWGGPLTGGPTFQKLLVGQMVDKTLSLTEGDCILDHSLLTQG
jgi:hypothetical protein